MPPAHAQLGLKAAGCVVKPRMDNLTVARRDAGSDDAFLLKNKDFAVPQSKRSRDRESDQARAYDNGFNLNHLSLTLYITQEADLRCGSSREAYYRSKTPSCVADRVCLTSLPALVHNLFLLKAFSNSR